MTHCDVAFSTWQLDDNARRNVRWIANGLLNRRPDIEDILFVFLSTGDHVKIVDSTSRCTWLAIETARRDGFPIDWASQWFPHMWRKCSRMGNAIDGRAFFSRPNLIGHVNLIECTKVRKRDIRAETASNRSNSFRVTFDKTRMIFHEEHVAILLDFNRMD